MYYICKILREFFGLFGEQNFMYKAFQNIINKHPRTKIKRILSKAEPFYEYFMAYMRFKQHYGIIIPAEAALNGNHYEYVRIKVGDIKREWQGKVYSLKEVSPYKYLETKNKKIYEEYIKKLSDAGICSLNNIFWNVKDFDNLLKSIQKNGYDPKISVICVNGDNMIIDGQHRACCLLYLYGEDYEVNVVKVTNRP